jgi:hypothetical protein
MVPDTFFSSLTLETFGNDNYGRTIADLLLSDGTNVDHTLVKEGWCWWYQKYAPGDTVLEGLEDGSPRGEERLVGRSAAGAAVGVAENEFALAGDIIDWCCRARSQPASLSAGREWLA